MLICEKAASTSLVARFQDNAWDTMLVDDFGAGQTISEIFCYDFDEDGNDEIFVSVVGRRMLNVQLITYRLRIDFCLLRLWDVLLRRLPEWTQQVQSRRRCTNLADCWYFSIEKQASE